MAETPRFYLLYGDDEIAVDEALAQLREGMGDGPNAEINISEYDGDSTPLAKILNDVRSFPFLADKRLVIVRGLVTYLMKSNKDQVDTLVDAIPELPDHARLVLVERENLKSNLKIVKTAQLHGYCRQFDVPKDSTQWIMQRAKTLYEADIEPQAAAALATVTGDDLRRADNELVKLVSYVNGERPINEQDVALLTPYVAEANIFDLVDAMGNGDGRTAIALMTQVLDQDPSDPGFRLFAMIARQFRLLLLAREHLDNGGSTDPKVLGSVLKMHPFPAGKAATQSRRFTIEQLETIFKRIQQYDVEMKTGVIEPRLALELLVASLAKK